MRLGKLSNHGEPSDHWFELDPIGRLRHVYTIGKSGVGKSTFLAHQLLQDIEEGNGIALFDPHGALADTILSNIPRRRVRDVVLFDPSDRDWPVAFNPLHNIPPERRPFVASTIVDAFKAVWGKSWGPQLEMFLYASAAAMLDFPDGTLLGIKFMLTSKKFRTRVLSHVQDPALRDFWQTDFAKHMPDREQRERTLSTLNKIGQLITDPTIRNIIGQTHSRLSFTDVMDHRKIFIARIAQGDLGIQKSSLIGGLLLSNFHLHALQRKVPDPPLYLYADEFHNLGNVQEMLSGIRKFGVSLNLAHQYVGQLSDEMQDAVLGTVGTMVCFRIGPKDARELAVQFDKQPQQLADIPPYRAYVTTDRNTIEIHVPEPDFSNKTSKHIVQHSRSQYATPREAVERRITRFIGGMDESADKPRRKKGRHLL